MQLALPTIFRHARSHQIIASKSLGQHFLFDLNICNKIVNCASSDIAGKIVLEIGPGPGGLTRAILAKQPKKLIVIEKDIRFINLLNEIHALYPTILEIIHGDALNFSLSQFASEKLVIISNLPYNIGTKLLISWLQQISHVDQMIIMLQSEVVDRMIANNSNKSYGRLSVICQAIASLKKCFKISPQAFTPPPKIHSSVVSIIPKTKQLENSVLQNIQDITNIAFQNRRKKLKTALKNLLKYVNIDELKIDLNKRPEQISVADYISLGKLLFAVNNCIG